MTDPSPTTSPPPEASTSAASSATPSPSRTGPLDEARSVTWRRLRRMAAPRLTRANLLAGLLSVALGFALVAQIQQHNATGLQTLRQDELVRVLDDVSQRSARLDEQIRELEDQRDVLTSGVDNTAAAAAQAQRRVDELSILAGTVPAWGPGIRLTIEDDRGVVRARLLLDVLQELRDAGAEAIQIGSSRVVAGSYFSDAGPDVTLDEVTLRRPFVILAIGDPQTLASAMNIPGGVVNTVSRAGAEATVDQLDIASITALHTPGTPRYAQPAPETTPSSG